MRIAIPALAENFPTSYSGAICALGAEAVIAKERLDPLNFAGLLLPGGGDVDPSRYGQEMAGSFPPDPALDKLQFDVLDDFVKAGKPVFGICRGCQVVNVYFGGTLIQNVPQAARHRKTGGDDQAHGSRTPRDSFLYPLYGEAFPVNSAHHQAVDRLGDGLRAAQWSDDGLIEALAHETLPVWATQWHPERMCFAYAREDTVDGGKVIGWFLRQCEA